MSPDFGFILAWENRYVVPFLAGRIGVSIAAGSSDDYFRSCAFGGATLGFRISIGSNSLRWNLLLGGGANYLWNTERAIVYWNFGSAGVELIF